MAEEKSLEEMEDSIRIADAKRQMEEFEMLDKIKGHLLAYYYPVTDPADASFHYTTAEIFEQIQRLFPTSIYSPKDVAAWLNSANFTFWDYGAMRFEWLLKKA